MDLQELLDHRGIEYRKTNNPSEILIACTSGEHIDKSPSLSYNLEKNMFHCWSCNFSGGITKFMKSIGETVHIDVDSKQPYKIKKLKEKLQAVIEVDSLKLPESRILFDEDFKVCIPVYQFGKLKFIEGRLGKPVTDKPKYYRTPRKAPVAESLFPLDKIKNTNYVILVEGIFDMLNMWQLGYHNTLCIFGCTNFSRKKLDILDRIGVTRVDILMDPDVAGQRAANKIAELLDSKNIVSRNLVLPDGVDPGDLTQRQAERYMA